MWIEQEDNQDPYGRTTPAATGEGQSVGAGGGTAGTPTNTSGTASNPSTQTPTNTNAPTQNFGTVQDYLKGNQQQGEALGQQFTGNLGTSQTNEKSAIDTAANQTQSDINAGTTNYDAGLVNKAVSTPTAVTSDPGQLQSFLNQWNAAYTGPSSFESSANYAPASAAAAEGTNLGQEESTAGGQQQILHDQFGVYGQGNQGLDQAILQNSSYEPQIQQQAQQFGTIQNYLTNAAAPLDTAATNAATNTAAAQTNTRTAFANEPATFQTQINNEVSAAQAKATPIAQQYQTDLAAGNSAAVTADLSQMGASPAQIQSVTQYLTGLNKDYGQNPNLSNYYSYNPATDITAANTATTQDYNNAAAYQQLTGQDYSGILNPANAAQAATTPNPNSGINTPALQTYLQGQLQNQDKALLAPLSSSVSPGKVQVNPAINYMDSVANSVGQPNVWLPANQGNVVAGTQTAQALVDALTRSGAGSNDPRAAAAYQQAMVALNGIRNGGQNPADPSHAGLLAFTQILGNFVNPPANKPAIKIQ